MDLVSRAVLFSENSAGLTADTNGGFFRKIKKNTNAGLDETRRGTQINQCSKVACIQLSMDAKLLPYSNCIAVCLLLLSPGLFVYYFLVHADLS